MTPQEHIAFVRHYINRIVNEGDLTRIADYVAPSFVNHLSDGSVALGRDTLVAMLARVRAYIRDFQVNIDNIYGEEDRVVAFITVCETTTDRNQVQGWRGMITWRIQNDLLVERWVIDTNDPQWPFVPRNFLKEPIKDPTNSALRTTCAADSWPHQTIASSLLDLPF